MTPELLTILLVAIAGLPLALRLDREARGSLVGGEALLLGLGAGAASLFALSLVHVRWSVPALLVMMALFCAPVIPSAARDLKLRTRDLRSFAALRMPAAWAAVAMNGLTVLLVAGYARFATTAPLWEVDYLVDFGFKGRAFWEARGLDWSVLETAMHRVIHPDYPPLLPLVDDLFALVRGGWPTETIGIVTVVFAVALLLVVHRLTLEETGSPAAAAFVTLALVPFAASPWIGLGEGPLVAYATAGLLLVRRGSLTAGAVMLGLAASTKNEGLMLVVAAALGLACARRARELPRLWPALAIPLPWLLLRRLHHLQTDITEGDVLARVLAHVREPRPLLDALARTSAGKPVFWLALAAGMLIVLKPLLARERFVLTAVALQFLVYVGAYLATPHDVEWHVRWSWERLLSHLTPVLAYVVLVRLLAKNRDEALTNAPLVPML
jgi:hypothetical protein